MIATIEKLIEDLKQKAIESGDKSLHDLIDLGKDKLNDFLDFAQNTEVAFVAEQGKKIITYTEALAKGDISAADYENLMLDLKDLVAMKAAEAEVYEKVQVEDLQEKLESIFINGILSLLRY